MNSIIYHGSNFIFPKNTNIIQIQEDQIGNSDNDDIEDDPQDNNISKPAVLWFNIDGSVKAEHTTIIASDGRLKGNQLLRVCHRLVNEAFKEEFKKSTGNSFKETTKAVSHSLPEINANQDKVKKFLKASNWVFNLGLLAKSYASSEIQRRGEVFISPQNIQIGEDGIRLQVYYSCNSNTERLYLSDDFLQKWKENCFVSENIEINDEFLKKDLTYDQINWFNLTILEILKGFDPGFTDSALAKIQIQRLKFKEGGEWGNKIDELAAYEEVKDTIRIIEQYLDFLNALMFGLEASRVNATLVTGVMTLELIEAGHLTYKKAFYEDKEWGGQFPLATIGSGSNNFRARSVLLATENAGMKEDRRYPKWLAVTCKEAIIIKNWFNMKLGEKTKNYSTQGLLLHFDILIKDLIGEYYNIDLPFNNTLFFS